MLILQVRAVGTGADGSVSQAKTQYPNASGVGKRDHFFTPPARVRQWYLAVISPLEQDFGKGC